MKRRILDLAKRCISCGFCLEACPTYRLTGAETASPRGRIRLMASAARGEAPIGPYVLNSIDLCLGCRACESACPSGVRYGAIVESFRALVEEAGLRPGPQASTREGLIGLLRSPDVFAASVSVSRMADHLPGVAPIPKPLTRMLTGRDGSPPLMPALPPHPAVGALPTMSRAIGQRRYTVCMLQGCVMRVLYHRVNQATVRMLQLAGCDVLCPPELGCCGALDLHAGYHRRGTEVARAFLKVLEGYEFDAIVSNSAGCGSTLREYADLLADDPLARSKAAHLSARVRDVHEFLAEVGLPAPAGTFDALVTYHDACHLAHGQGIREAPRRLLMQVPGLRLVPLHESDMCCGSAGIYNMTQPDMARRLLERKVDNIAATSAEVVAMGNPGCMAWIETGLRQRGMATRVMHVVEILDAAWGADAVRQTDVTLATASDPQS